MTNFDDMSRRKIIMIHIFIWLFAIFANLPHFGRNMAPQLIVSSLIGFLYLMVVFYVFYLWLAPAFLNRKRLFGFFGFSLVVILIMPFFGYNILFLSRAIFDHSFSNFYKGYSLKTHMSAFYPVLTAAVFGSFFSVIISWFTTMNQKSELDRQKLAIELELLKSKLNPHFLFNTLNNIDTLITTNPREASDALIKLSDMMRYLTYDTSESMVPVEKEIEYIRNFVSLHRMRIKDPDCIRFSFGDNIIKEIAPALFVPLLENAFKFADLTAAKPCIDISFSESGNKLFFRITNAYDRNSAKHNTGRSGYGLVNLRKRLELAYPGKHSLSIENDGKFYSASLMIDTNEN
ncbi:MAG TPA: sensor histidine kinase [Bacteroidales bacterium]|nr:sensor histidine kinase [Bacteroidales bacterium]